MEKKKYKEIPLNVLYQDELNPGFLFYKRLMEEDSPRAYLLKGKCITGSLPTSYIL